MSQQPEETTRVTLSFNRHLTDEEIAAIKANTDAIEAAKADPTHHHDHDTKLA
jgi:hypothetical protein